MKPSLTSLMASGTFALLVGLTFALTPTRALGSRPDGYTDSGQPYYYAYPDEGFAEEENTDESSTMSLQMPPDYSSMAPADEYGYDDSYVEPYYNYGGGWLSYGALNGNPNGVRNGGFNRHSHFSPQFSHQNGMHHNFFSMHSPAHSSVGASHQNFGGKSSVAGGGHVMAAGAVHAGGSGHGGGGGHR
jgi:hypothetical protein